MNTETKANSASVAGSWEAYWRGAAGIGSDASGGANHPAIRAFWKTYFAALPPGKPLSLLDVASGKGAVIESAQKVAHQTPMDICCIDISPSAVSDICTRLPGVRGVVCDARSIPMDSGAFDIVTSQFGVEYAGREAIYEVARLLAEGGEMALLLHHRDGLMHLECAASLDAIRKIQQSRFIPMAMEMFKAGFAAIHGADRAPYDLAGQRLAPAVKTLEEIMTQHGTHVAGDTVVQLYGQVAQIHEKLPNYDSEVVLGWLHRLDGELDAYACRMSSMMDSAIDGEVFKEICADLESRHCILGQAGPLMAPDSTLPLAWVIVAARPVAQVG